MNLYFDAAATTPLDLRVKQAMLESMDIWGNENSKHVRGVESRRAIDDSLERIASVLGVSKDQLAVTYSGTDANRRVVWACRNRFGHESLWSSAVEHSSVADETLETNRFDPRDPDSVRDRAQFLALMQANSETGAVYDIVPFREKFSEALILSDCAQSFPKGIMPDFKNSDFVTFAPQKFYGPKMVGLVYMKHPELFPEISKDSHTKNVFLVAGMAKAFEVWEQEKVEVSKNMEHWTCQIEDFIQKNIPEYKIHNSSDKRVSGIINVAFQGIRGSELMTVLSEEEGICVSTGSACTTDILSPTPVIRFLEPDPRWQYPIRISLHKFLTDQDINHFCEVLGHYVEELRK